MPYRAKWGKSTSWGPVSQTRKAIWDTDWHHHEVQSITTYSRWVSHLRCGQETRWHNLRLLSIAYKGCSSTTFTSCLENQDAIFCLGEVSHCLVKAFAFNSAASTLDFVSQGVSVHTGIKGDVLHWFLEWFFMNLFICRNCVTHAFVMTLLSVIF